jgi:hypothetical protein
MFHARQNINQLFLEVEWIHPELIQPIFKSLPANATFG